MKATSDLKSLYRREGEFVLIEMELKRLEQLFNTFDPSPFYEKDIDNDAEQYIVDSAREIPMASALKLVIYLPPAEAVKEDADSLEEAIHNYFAYRVNAAARELRLQFHQGRLSLAIGLSFLTACVVLRSILLGVFGSERMVMDIVQEGLLISGWVVMWRPFEMLVYDWWPLWIRKRVYRKLSRMEVSIVPSDDRPRV
jgi:hypothetical protein